LTIPEPPLPTEYGNDTFAAGLSKPVLLGFRQIFLDALSKFFTKSILAFWGNGCIFAGL
jgi:hypothetical protein